MALVHDIVEIDAGDTFAYDDAEGAATKDAREEAAADRLFGLLPAGDRARDCASCGTSTSAATRPRRGS